MHRLKRAQYRRSSAIPAFRYTCYGLNIRSDLALPHLCAATSDVDDVTVTFGTVAGVDGDPARLRNWVGEPGGFRIAIKDVARFAVSGGTAIVIDPAPGAPEREVAIYLTGCALAAALQQRGIVPLHASAVATPNGALLVTGVSGAGKSTLLGTLVARGFAMLADDVSAIRIGDDGVPVVHPAFPAMRLWRTTLDGLGIDATGLEPVRDGTDKYYRPVPNFHAGALPLAAIVMLSAHDGALSILRPAPVDRLAGVATNIYRRKFLQPQKIHAQHFAAAARIAQHADIIRVKRPAHPFDPHGLADRVLAALGLSVT